MNPIAFAIKAILPGTNNLSKFVRNTSKEIFIPLTVGGGIRTIQDIEMMLKNGADKVSINSSAIDNINFVYKVSNHEQNQHVVLLIISSDFLLLGFVVLLS